MNIDIKMLESWEQSSGHKIKRIFPEFTTTNFVATAFNCYRLREFTVFYIIVMLILTLVGGISHYEKLKTTMGSMGIILMFLLVACFISELILLVIKGNSARKQLLRDCFEFDAYFGSFLFPSARGQKLKTVVEERLVRQAAKVLRLEKRARRSIEKEQKVRHVLKQMYFSAKRFAVIGHLEYEDIYAMAKLKVYGLSKPKYA